MWRSRGLRAAVGVLLVPIALAGCSISTTSTDPFVSGSATPTAVSSAKSSGTPAPALDLQLRPVLGGARAGAAGCASPAPPTPPREVPATLCSGDRSVSYDLGPAAVTGDRVTSVRAIASVDGPIVQVKLDAQGAASLRTVTLAGSLATPQPSLAIVTRGQVLAAPVMTEELDGGVLLISGFDTLEQAQGVLRYVGG